MKKRIVLIVIAIIGFAASGLFATGVSDKGGDKAYNVALSVVWEGNTYAAQSREEFYTEVERQKELGKVDNVYYMSADFSAEKQVSDLEDLYTRDVDILIVQPVNPPALNEIIQKFHDQGTIVIPCVSPLATDAYTVSMMSNDFEFGRIGAEFLVEALGGEGNIIALDGMDGITVAINRWEGALKVFEKYPGIEVLAKPFADWDYAKGKTATENLLAAFPEIDGVWSSGGDMTRGAIEAFVEANPENAISGTYPLSRFLYVYVNKAPGKPLPPLTGEFIKLVLSRAGQEVVVKDGYIPLPAKVAARELKKIQ